MFHSFMTQLCWWKFPQDQQLMRLNEEVARLRTFEFDSVRKDTLIQQLQQQIGDMQVCDFGGVMMMLHSVLASAPWSALLCVEDHFMS